VQYALSLAQEANGRLTLLHVMDWLPKSEYDAYPQFDSAGFRRFVSAEARRKLELLVPEEARNWCEPDLRLTCGKAYREILRVAGEEHADLIVLGVHGFGTVDRLIFGSTTQHVVRQAACPVLTTRA
jgi:nucleotide-binding universal stress UspA family protein